MMTAGIRGYRKLQFGRETTPGAAVPATTLWRGLGVIDDQRESEEIEEDIGIWGGIDREVEIDTLGGIEIADTPFTFEQAPYLLAMLLGSAAPVAGVQDGSGSGYIYEAEIPFQPAPDQIPTAQTYTFQGGDNAEVEQIEHCFATQFKLSGKGKEVIKMSATLQGRNVQRLDSGFTPGVSIPPVSEALTTMARLFLDNEDVAFGTTPISKQIMGFELTFGVEWGLGYTLDETTSFSSIDFGVKSIEGNIIFKHSSLVVGLQGEKENWRRKKPRLIRLLFRGKPLTTPGTYTHHTLLIDLPIKWKKFNPLSDEDNNVAVTADWKSRGNLTIGSAGRVLIVNELPELP